MPVAIIEIVLSIAAILGGAFTVLSKLFGEHDSFRVKRKGTDEWVEVNDLSKKDLKRLRETLAK
jgi:hypothetical protein